MPGSLNRKWALVKYKGSDGRIHYMPFELPADYRRPGFESFFRRHMREWIPSPMIDYRIVDKATAGRLSNNRDDVDDLVGVRLWWDEPDESLNLDPAEAGVNKWQAYREGIDQNQSRTRPPGGPSGRMNQLQQEQERRSPHIDNRPGRPVYRMPMHQQNIGGRPAYYPLMDESRQGYRGVQRLGFGGHGM